MRKTTPSTNGHCKAVPVSPTENPVEAAESDVPSLSEEDQAALASFREHQEVLRNLTLGCIDGNHTGAYICGPPGVSKTFTVHNTLRERRAYWQPHQRITAKPLYLELEKHSGAVHIIDDCEQLFLEKSALTLLRSALDAQRVRGRRERLVSFSVAGSRARVLEHYFFGAIIFTSNRPLTDERPEIRAVLSRIPCVWFAPPVHEIRALMRHVARQVHTGEAGNMSPSECVEVVEYVIQLAAELQSHLDLRWIEHGYGHYLTHVTSGGTVDWRDMVKFHIMNTLTYFDHTPPPKQLQANEEKAELRHDSLRQIAIAQETAQKPGLSRDDRLRLWEERTGLSRATFYRRLAASRTGEGAE